VDTSWSGPDLASEILAEGQSLADLRDEVAKLIFEKDFLVSRRIPHLLNLYTLKFGARECEIFELETRILMLRRQIELVQVEINHQRELDLEEILQRVETMFEDNAQKIEVWREAIKESTLAFQGESLSNEDYLEFKNNYLFIVKKTHPDINPNPTEEQLELFNLAVKAFESGDWLVMANLKYLVEVSETSTITLGPGELAEAKEKLSQVKTNLLAEIEGLQKSFPLNQLALLESQELTKKKIKSLNELKEKLTQELAVHQSRWLGLIDTHKDSCFSHYQ
jgi:archaellum component FlaC